MLKTPPENAVKFISNGMEIIGSTSFRKKKKKKYFAKDVNKYERLFLFPMANITHNIASSIPKIQLCAEKLSNTLH